MNASPRRVVADERTTKAAPATDAAPRTPNRSRLVVELNRATAADLDELVELEELNKTTITNRALQLYAMLRKVQRDGGQILLQDAGAKEPERIHFL
jgi:hypothetical protein